MKLQDFAGHWRLSRVIMDHLAGTEARFEGAATWEPDGEGLIYHETGTLLTPQGRFAAERRYLWRSDLMVYFEDGRFFHQVPLNGAEAVHLCDPDIYRVTYEFRGPFAYTTVWRVEGPRKGYTMRSEYLKQSTSVDTTYIETALRCPKPK